MKYEFFEFFHGETIKKNYLRSKLCIYLCISKNVK